MLLLALLAFIIRGIVVLCFYRDLPVSADHNEFGWEQGWIARSIALGHGFSSPFQPLDDVPTALVAPLYPYLLAGIFRVFGLYSAVSALVALGLNALISASVVFPVYEMARRAVAGSLHSVRTGLSSHAPATALTPLWVRRVPWMAAALWSVYPYSVTFSGSYIWDHTLTGALFAWTFLFALQLRRFGVLGWASWGLLYGVTALSNPSVLSLLPALVLIAVIGQGMPVRRGLTRVAVAAAVLALTLLPWTVRNVRTLHALVPMRDGYWGEFYAGNNDDTSHTNPDWTHPASNAAELRRYEQLGEVRYMAEKRTIALKHVSEKPGLFAVQCLRRTVRFWTGFWSFSSSYLQGQALDVPNVPFCTALALLTFFGLRSLLRQHRRAALCFLAVVVLFPLPYYLTHASVDYRQPIEPEIVVLIAVGGAELCSRWQARRAARTQLAQGVLVGS
ncbi:hypothetical protein [Terriglobus sp.]|uniref:hypothetical protein n=1 Tax=Terriglobus sp. TaxID=1889013 RepID=UPI003AFFB119